MHIEYSQKERTTNDEYHAKKKVAFRQNNAKHVHSGYSKI